MAKETNDPITIDLDTYRQITLQELAKMALVAEGKEPTMDAIATLIDIAETDASATYCDVVQGKLSDLSASGIA